MTPLEFLQFAKQSIVFGVVDFRTIFDVVEAIVPVKFASELFQASLYRD